jgi:rod shape-determining protein MreC
MRLVWWLATVMGIGLVSIVLSEQRALDPVHNLSLTASAPVQSTLRDIASPIDDIFQSIRDRGSLTRENRALQEENERLRAQIAEQQNAEQRIRELEEALGVKQSRPEDDFLVADVIAQHSSGIQRAIAINRGRGDGIDEGMVVLSRNGSLVGTVTRVFEDFAWVRLITDPDAAVNSQVNIEAEQPAGEPAPPEVLTPGEDENDAPQETDPAPEGEAPADGEQPAETPAPAADPVPPQPARGVAVGNLRQGVVVELLPSDTPIAEGDLVVTSGLGGNYPPGILIGSVQSLEQRLQSPFQKAVLQPAAHLRSLDTVLVLISFRPARLGEP